MEKEASEENVKNVTSPYILHIATHGFFKEVQFKQSNISQLASNFYDNPFLRSGLLLAGAELSINRQENGREEDGILTAMEAMNLNLENTDLVVLSACETGLGEVKNGEDVFGLRRALQEAGAKSVVMSLWKVDDTATYEFMTYFYENMLLKKQNKRTALRNAEIEMKCKYQYPYYWGPFVIVGE